MRQSHADDIGELRPKNRIRRVQRRSHPSGGEKPEPVADEIACASGHGFRPAHLCVGRLLVELEQQYGDRNTSGKGKKPKAKKTDA